MISKGVEKERDGDDSLITAAPHETQNNAVMDILEIGNVTDKSTAHPFMMLVFNVLSKYTFLYSNGTCSSSSSSDRYFYFADCVFSLLFFLWFAKEFRHSFRRPNMMAAAPAIPKANFTYFLSIKLIKPKLKYVIIDIHVSFQ